MSVQVVFLGTNGWYDTDTGNTVCVLVRSSEHTVIFDAGNGLYKADRYVPAPPGIGYLMLSHFHLDHVAGLHVLNKLRCFEKLRIFGPEQTRTVLEYLLDSPFTLPASQLPYAVEVFELPRDRHDIPFDLEAIPLLHGTLSLGFRIKLDGRIIAYCPDTGYCEEAVRLARRADLLVAECSYRSGQSEPRWPHLNPEDAGRIAREASARSLALFHFDASRYQTLEEREAAAESARRIFPHTVAAKDDMVIPLR